MSKRIISLVGLVILAIGDEIRAISILVSDDRGRVLTVNTVTGESEELLKTPVVMDDIAAPHSGPPNIAYAIGGDRLWVINIATGEVRLIGVMNITSDTFFGRQQPTALDIARDGTLYTLTFNSIAFNGAVFSNDGGWLIELDKENAWSRRIGETGFGTAGGFVVVDDYALMTHCPMTAFMNCSERRDNNLVIVELATGQGAVIGSTGISKVTGLVLDGSKLLGVTKDGGIFDIDQATGVATFMTWTDPILAMTGATNMPLGAYELRLVPEPSSILLLLIGLIILLNRRRNSRSFGGT